MTPLGLSPTLPPGVDRYWQLLKQDVLPPLVLALVCWFGSDVNYLLFHTLAEGSSILIALTALTVATTSLRFTRNHFVVYLAVALGWCALLDAFHTLVFKGMNVLPVTSANMATQFWVAARLLQALAFLTAPLMLRHPLRLGAMHLIYGGLALGACLLILTGHFPVAYVEGQGLTPFKIGAEYGVILALALTLVLLWRQRRLIAPHLFYSMVATLVATMASELAFTQYVNVYAHANLIGHLLKIFAYWFLFYALVQHTLREPFSMLSRAASTYEAVPDPTLIMDERGTILQANGAAARHTGLGVEQLVGRSSHQLFHDADLKPEACPVCAQLASRTHTFLMEIPREGGRSYVECSVAPLTRHSWLQVIRDITDRKQLATEREALLRDLSKRIQELTCTYAMSQLIEKPGLQPDNLLEGIAALLPAAFRWPKDLHAHVQSDWGQFGHMLPEALPPERLERPILVDGRQRGSLVLWYEAGSHASGQPFLPEESVLADSAAQRLGETLERLQGAETIQRLSYLYAMLSGTNRSIIHCKSESGLLDSLFQTLVAHGPFPMLAIARTDNGHLPLLITHAHGISDGARLYLGQALSDPRSHFGALWPDIAAGRVIYHPVADQDTPETTACAAWHGYLQEQGITQFAIMPLMREGEVMGIVALYARGHALFDQEQLQLLDEMTSDLGFALNKLISEKLREEAEKQASLSEGRFREVFQASPLPIQIRSLSTHVIRAINRAHESWLGYSLDDIGTEKQWYDQAYPDPTLRARAQTNWQEDLSRYLSGEPLRSEEMLITCKDGQQRIAQATITVVGDDALLAWTDLTEIRRSEQTLRESEQRFRCMIEQTVSGICVIRDDRFIYANPRFCELVGWAESQLLGQSARDLMGNDASVRQTLEATRARLERGEHNLNLRVSLHRRDGSQVDLELYASPITWNDGHPAHIVMAQDITDSRIAEAQIANYVKQLEASMKATFQAVSNMVELRDPYTAGHERRVGLLAGAIAREMGWPEHRCENLELTGLVHDIGKIAVPSEILTKPTRLSPLEMELIKVHAQAGYEILKDVPFAAPVAETIRQHHERMDGSGYPRGLKAADILPEARVLAVADVIESMSAHRPYRPALGIDAALEEIEKGRDRLYDPEVADAAIRLIRDKHYLIPQ